MTRIWWCQEHHCSGAERICAMAEWIDEVREPSTRQPCRMVPMRLIPDNEETRWLCDYPEFGDDACMVDHDPVSTRQPRKHTTCGWFLTVPVFVDAALDGEAP